MADVRRATEVRQVELTDAALRIIATRGIAALSTRSLAEQVGLTTGAIFRHFASLDALLEAVAARVETVLESTYPPADRPPRERLERFIEARSAPVGQLGIPRLMLSEQFLLALPEGASNRLARCVERTRAFLLGCIQDGQADGTIRDDVDAGALSVIAMGAVQMLALSRHKIGRRPTDATAVLATLATLLDPVEPKRAGRKRNAT